MHLKKLKLTNFRTYGKLEVDFSDQVLIVGKNTQGKTNLLESIYLLSLGKSFRAKEKDMISWDEDFFRIEGVYEKDKSDHKIEYIYEKNVGKGRKTVKVNGSVRRTTALLEGLKVVFFSPDELDIFFGFPSARRRYMNVLISQAERGYSTQLLNYYKTLKQRNALLKSIKERKASEDNLEIWDGKIAEVATEIIEKRIEMVEKINKHLPKIYKTVSKTKQDLKIAYVPSFKMEKEDKVWGLVLKALLNSRRKDIEMGATSVGPHRGDMSVYLGEKEMGVFGSRGERRSAILSLKLAEMAVLEEELKEKPLLLLDDVFSELDEGRREFLTSSFEDQQTFVTTTDIEFFPKKIKDKAQVLKIENNKLKEA